ncbi:dTTP/UTP pyrophosphatase [Monosporozyma unispora]|nr:hypothetical protein C6P44_003583 [Kazachstania unispora]
MSKETLNNKLAHYEFILASSSPRRFEIVHDYMNIQDITVVKPSFEENLDKELYKDDPSKYVHDTCLGKAKSIMEEHTLGRDSKTPLGAIVICADTIVVGPDKKIYEKPGSKETQLKYLNKFCYEYGSSGKPVKVITSVVVIKDSKGGHTDTQQFEEVTDIHFDSGILHAVIENYVESEDGLQVAGGFKIQGPSGVLIRSIEGDYYNVVGLPLNRTYTTILDFIQ